MAEAKIEIRAEGGAQTASEISKATAAAEKLLARQQKIDQDMKWDKAIDSIGRLASKFSGFTQEAIDGVEKVAKGFLVGGPLLGGLAAVIEVTGLITRKLEEQEKAWKEEHDAAVETGKRQEQALQAVRAETEKLAIEERALFIAKKEGISIDEARAKAAKEAIVLTREEGVAKMANLRAQLDAENAIIFESSQKRVAAEIDAEMTSGDRLRKAAREGVNETAQQSFARKDAIIRTAEASKAKAAELAAQILALDEAMIGSAQKVRNAEKRIELDRETASLDRSRKGGEDAARKADEERRRQEEQDIAVYKDIKKRRAEIDKKAAQDALDLQKEAEKQKRDQEEQDIAVYKDIKKRRQKKEEEDANFAREVNQNKVEKLNKRLSDEKAKDDENKKKAGEAFANAGLAGVDALKALATGQEEFTKAALDERAKQAGIEALFNAGLALAALGTAALGNPQGLAAAAAYGASAAQFAAIAGVSKAASAAAPSAAPAQASGGGASSGSGGSRGGGGTNITVVLPQSGRLYPMNDELLRGVRAANREAARR